MEDWLKETVPAGLGLEDWKLVREEILESKEMSLAVLLGSGVTVGVNGWIPKRAFKVEVGLLTRDFSRTRKIPFLDYRSGPDSKIYYDGSLFHDRSHLNEKGAEVFTQLILKDLKKYR